jgi:hypothetical protein
VVALVLGRLDLLRARERKIELQFRKLKEPDRPTIISLEYL